MGKLSRLLKNIVFKKNEFIIAESDLGHTISTFRVITDLSLSEIKEFDFKYGMKHRFQSTYVSQISKGALKEGRLFTAFPLEVDINHKSKHHVDYTCRYGNY